MGLQHEVIQAIQKAVDSITETHLGFIRLHGLDEVPKFFKCCRGVVGLAQPATGRLERWDSVFDVHDPD